MATASDFDVILVIAGAIVVVTIKAAPVRIAAIISIESEFASEAASVVKAPAMQPAGKLMESTTAEPASKSTAAKATGY